MKRIELFKDGENRTPLSAEAINELVRLINSIGNMEVVIGGTQTEFVAEQSKSILRIPKSFTEPTESGTGNVNYRGAWSALSDYEINDLVFTSPREFYIAEIQSGPSYGGAHSPAFPEPSSSPYWRCVSPATTAQIAKVSGHYGDYLTGALWSGSAWGSDIYIAKPPLLRFSITSYYYQGVTVNYSSYSTSVQTRAASFSSTSYSGSEVQTIIRPYQADDVIWVAKTNKTIVTVSGAELDYIDLNVDGRAWAKKYSV